MLRGIVVARSIAMIVPAYKSAVDNTLVALHPGAVPDGLARDVFRRPTFLAQRRAPRRVQLGQSLHKLEARLAEEVHEMLATLGAQAWPQLAALCVAPESVGGHAVEAPAPAALSGRPGVVPRGQGEDGHAEREGVGEKAVVLGGGVHLWRLVRRLAPKLPAASPAQGRHPEVDQLDLQTPVTSFVQDNVLRGQVAMNYAQLVQPPDRVEDLYDDWVHDP